MQFLPGSLYRYLDDPLPEPSWWSYQKAHNISNVGLYSDTGGSWYRRADVFHGQDLGKYHHLVRLREACISGYYRQASALSRERLLLTEGEACDESRQIELLAEIFCSLHPFNRRLAYRISYSMNLLDLKLRRLLARSCIVRFNLGAFRFFSGPFNDDIDKVIDTGLATLGFHPGYAEALAFEYPAEAYWKIIEYLLPETYERIRTQDVGQNMAEPNAYLALKAGNYRLAKHLKAKYPEKNFGEYVLRAGWRNPSKRWHENLAWMLKHGWITEAQLSTGTGKADA